MKINSVARLEKGCFGRNIAFKRKLKEEEKAPYTEAVNQALDYLGIVNRAMIIHGASFPSDTERDVEQKVGSPFGSEKFLDFIKLHGFNAVQLGPEGKLNKGDNSPYSSSIFAKNPLFIDLSQLTTPKFAMILSEDDLYSNTHGIQVDGNNYATADYQDAEKINENLLSIAYDNFIKKVNNNSIRALDLDEEFQNFRRKNAYWLEYYAVLDTISKKYGTDYYPNWDKKDAELISKVKQGDKEALQYYNDIKTQNEREINIYEFTQFVIDKQSKEDDKKREGITYIGDLLVGASSFDELIYSDVFKKGYKIGCKKGGPFDSPQLWNISLVDPDKLFNPDGSLASGGQYLKLKLQKALQDAESIRIDHAMGLVDPYIYKPETAYWVKKKDEHGNVVHYPLREKLKGGYLSELKIDPDKNYQQILPRIILPTMKEMGVNPYEVVWEDLGDDETGVFTRIFKNELRLPGINVLAWERGENSKPHNWAYIGCHDNLPVQTSVKKGDIQKNDAWNLDYLSGYLNPHPKRQAQRENFKNAIKNNPKALIKAKWADLMRSTKNIQISFMDFFGINKPYNIPGSTGPHNWTLRLNPDYEDSYYKALQKDEYAINMPEILAIALQAKSDMDIVKGEKSQYRSEMEVAPMIEKLNYYSSILKE